MTAFSVAFFVYLGNRPFADAGFLLATLTIPAVVTAILVQSVGSGRPDGQFLTFTRSGSHFFGRSLHRNVAARSALEPLASANVPFS